MSIGVFDSGVGGLTIHRELVREFPRADFVYFADQANVPYGVRSGEDIYALTQAGCERLFEQGCSLIVLACNTACAVALRKLQMEWLAGQRQSRGRQLNILGIIVPTIEQVTGVDWGCIQGADQSSAARRSLALFATKASVRSSVYDIEIAKRNRQITVFSEVCMDLARLIEEDASAEVLEETVRTHVGEVSRRIGGAPDQAILGSTHYEIVHQVFEKVLPETTEIIRQPVSTARSLGRYLERHPEYDAGSNGGRRFLTTGRPGLQNGLVERFWGAPLHFEPA